MGHIGSTSILRHRRTLVVALGAGLAFSSAASAVPIDWSNPSGTNPNNFFSWSVGQSNDDNLGLPTGLWGEPTATNSGFLFDAIRPEFEAVATGGGGATTQSEMDVDIQALGPAFTELHIVEKGTYTGSFTDVSNSVMSVEIFQFLAMPFVLTTITVPIVDLGNGNWEARLNINDLTTYAGIMGPLGNWSLSVTNILQASSNQGDASIDKTIAQIDFPEPATLSMLLIGFAQVISRRKKCRN